MSFAGMRQLSIGHLKECNAHVCRTCYQSANALKKMEDDVTTRSRTMSDNISVATTFFASSKRVWRVLSPVPLSPSSALRSPLPKRPTSDSTTAVRYGMAGFAQIRNCVESHSCVGNTQRGSIYLGQLEGKQGVLSTEDTLQGIHLVWRKLQRCLRDAFKCKLY